MPVIFALGLMELINATEDDLKIVSSWVDSIKTLQYWAGPNVSYPINVSVLASEIGLHENCSYTWLEENTVLGFGQIIETANGTGHLARIIVNPNERGKGFGRMLFESLVQIASNKWSVVTLNVYRNNEAAVGLYKTLGFEEDEEKSNNGHIFMAKT